MADESLENETMETSYRSVKHLLDVSYGNFEVYIKKCTAFVAINVVSLHMRLLPNK